LQQALPSFSCVGLEPDKKICAAARASGLPVVEGRFPSALGAAERFDVIVFNDVFEHLPDSRAILRSVRDHLTPNGLVVINAPNRSGAIYQIAKLLARAGVRWLFERMWQLGLPSPHLQYFSRDGLVRLVCSAGFAVERIERLPAVRLRGLLARVRYTKDSGVAMSGIIFALGVLVLPLLRLLPSDAVVVYGRRLETGDKPAMPG
jgi:SAM-dependent methyltransferase